MLQRMKKITVSDIKSIQSLQKNCQLLLKQVSASYIHINDEDIIIYTTQSILSVRTLNTPNFIFEQKIPLSKIKCIERSGILLAIICAQTNQLIIVNMQTHKIDHLEGHICPVNQLIFFNNSFVTASKDLTIRLWQIFEEKSKENNKNFYNLVKHPIALKGHKGSVTALAVYDKFLISGSDDRTIICWVNKQVWTCSQPFKSQVIKILCCPLSSQVLILTKDNTVHFIPINSIAKKKIQIKGSLNVSEMTLAVQMNELDQSFVVILGKKEIKFIEVNLIQQMHQISIQNEVSQRITYVRCKGRCIFYGENYSGVKLLKI